MRLRSLLLLTLLGLTTAGLVVWATAAPGGEVHAFSPVVAQYQLAILVTGPSPDVTIRVFGYSYATGVTSEHVRQVAPIWTLFPVLGWIILVMVDDAVPRKRRPASSL